MMGLFRFNLNLQKFY